MVLPAIIPLIFNLLKLILLLALIVYFVVIVIDILKRSFVKPYIKWIWLALVTFIPIIGMAIYWYVFKKNDYFKNE
jgi:hypothetical protein